jgi:RNAse (barnase) inhibitor barstar
VDDIELDGRAWQTKDDFSQGFLAAVTAPDWHGRNLDALWDSNVGGNVNGRELPYRVVIHGCRHMGEEARQMVERFQTLIEEAKSEGHPVDIVVLDPR